jgi:hypothetical protein
MSGKSKKAASYDAVPSNIKPMLTGRDKAWIHAERFFGTFIMALVLFFGQAWVRESNMSNGTGLVDFLMLYVAYQVYPTNYIAEYSLMIMIWMGVCYLWPKLGASTPRLSQVYYKRSDKDYKLHQLQFQYTVGHVFLFYFFNFLALVLAALLFAGLYTMSANDIASLTAKVHKADATVGMMFLARGFVWYGFGLLNQWMVKGGHAGRVSEPVQLVKASKHSLAVEEEAVQSDHYRNAATIWVALLASYDVLAYYYLGTSGELIILLAYAAVTNDPGAFYMLTYMALALLAAVPFGLGPLYSSYAWLRNGRLHALDKKSQVDIDELPATAAGTAMAQ